MKGIKCTSNEVNAILAGDKGQIRLVIKPQPCGAHAPSFQKYSDIFCFEDKFGGIRTIKSPHQIGDLVFVKESFYQEKIWYKDVLGEWECMWGKTINYEEKEMYDKRPAQHMKQHQSRITLRIKDISVERLQSISFEDAIAEGVRSYDNSGMVHLGYLGERDAFMATWNATHKKPEEKWEANPFIFKIEFEVVK